MSAASEEGNSLTIPAEKREYRITITCGTWAASLLLGRLWDGGCPIRHCRWVEYDADRTIQCVVEMTETGRTAMLGWLRETYVIPKELDISISPTD
jgi:hypothetical protein